MKSKIYYFLLLILFSSSCSNKLTLKVINIHSINEYLPNYIIYYLPKTKIIIELELSKITEQPGPYSLYTQEFLGNINNVITNKRTYWQISDIKINTQGIRDTNNLWVISSNNTHAYKIQLTPEGFIASFNTKKQKKYHFLSKEEKFIEQTKFKSYPNNSLIIDRGYKEVYDTIIKIEKTDSLQRIVPIIKKRFVKKTTREQAKEIANEIFNIREDRAALLVGEGDSEYLPDGQALKIMLEGLDKLEEKYLSLFVGRVDKVLYHYKYQIVPDIKNKIYKTIIFRFSKENGLLPYTDMRGEAVYLIIKILQTTNPIIEFNNKQSFLERVSKKSKKTKNFGLAYRIPEIAIVQVKLGNRLLAQKYILLAQAGSVQRLPHKLFLKNNVQVIFNPYTGAIESIQSD